MNRTQKAALVERLGQELTSAPLVVLADYRGSTVAEVTELRRKLDDRGVSMRVVKNTLTRRAIASTPMEGLERFLTGMTVIFIGKEDGVGAAKVLKEALDPKGHVQVKGAWFDGEVYDAKGLDMVAALPSREELLSLLLRTIQEGPRQVMNVIRAPARDLLYLLKNFESKLAEEGATE